MVRKHYNPNQLEFPEMINRDILPIDTRKTPGNRQLPPLIIAAIISIHEQLKGLNIAPESSFEIPRDDH